MRRSRADQAVLITSAPESNDDEYDRRRRKYALMMGIRALSIIAAALVYRTSIWLALAFVAASLVLPWCAVLIANDRPAKKKAPPPTYRAGTGQERAITSTAESRQDTRIVDG